MSDQEHDLASEFPDAREILHRLKIDNQHFQTLSARHHQINKEINRVEAGIDTASDARLEEMKKQRLDLLDQIAAMISESRSKA